MMVFIYAADLYCEECGEEICKDLTAKGLAPEDPDDEYSYDSDDYPKGPMDEGESDTPTYCGGCGVFLESSLTSEGNAYVIEAVRRAHAEGSKDAVSLTEWAPYYNYLDFGDGVEDDDPEDSGDDEAGTRGVEETTE